MFLLVTALYPKPFFPPDLEEINARFGKEKLVAEYASGPFFVSAQFTCQPTDDGATTPVRLIELFLGLLGDEGGQKPDQTFTLSHSYIPGEKI